MTLEALRSDLLRDVRHGYFTRKGGASSGIFAGLNCGPGSSDQSDCVALNRARVAEAMEVAPAALLSLSQVHSPDVVTVRDVFEERPRADAMVTDVEGLALGILTADCAPVLFADREAGVVAAAHAGWKGALGGVLEATADAMRGLGARRIKAAIGPTIGPASYEVGLDFMERFLDDAPEHQRFFSGGRDPDHVQFDLPAFILNRLREDGIEAEWIRHDTYADEDRFFSYRRTVHRGEADYGRLISVIRL
ncbi:MAG: peptidoglycan editing factor PgeF [Rubricella sp.]